MAKRPTPRKLSDAYTKARSPGAKPSRVSFIVGGIKYKSGNSPVRVCPAAAAVPRGMASPVRVK